MSDLYALLRISEAASAEEILAMRRQLLVERHRADVLAVGHRLREAQRAMTFSATLRDERPTTPSGGAARVARVRGVTIAAPRASLILGVVTLVFWLGRS